MARWAHLFPSRTQKLSTAVAKVVGLWPGENSAPPGFFFYGGIFDLSAAFWPPFYCLDQHINFQMIPSPSAGLLRRLW